MGLFDGLLDGLIGGLFYRLIGGLLQGRIIILIVVPVFWIRGIRKSLMNDIQTVEALSWHWNKAIRGAVRVGLISGLIFGLIKGLDTGRLEGLFFGLFFGLFSGLFGGLFGAVIFGLNSEILETKATPNQGIRLSARNSLYGGLIVGLGGAPIFVLIGGGGYLLPAGVLWYGGLDTIQHYVLRLILIVRGYTPRNYARFLDHTVDLIFLQKVGGGYRFIHRMLLEHFANMQETE